MEHTRVNKMCEIKNIGSLRVSPTTSVYEVKTFFPLFLAE